MSTLIQQQSWKGKISNHAQLGGIETAVLDNGPGRGSRYAWISTGTGLRIRVAIDRALDIADAFFNQYSLAWLSDSGLVSPQPNADKGLDWLRSFGGGLLTTCGLTHVGGPEKDAYGERGLHGEISNTPAEVLSIQQPDLHSGQMEMHIRGRVKQTRVFGPRLELLRSISATLGSSVISIEDEIINHGNMPAPHMLLYHCNFSWPLVDEGAHILWNGEWKARDENSAQIFKKDNDFQKCPPPLEKHNGAGEAVAFIDADTDTNGFCHCGIYNPQLQLALIMHYQKQQLPSLTNWQHWGKGEYVTALEPGTHPPIGQAKAREEGTLILLEPGERRKYSLKFEVIHQNKELEKILQYNH